MAEGRDRADWNRAARICHTIARTFGGGRPKITDYHPYYGDSSQKGVSLDITNKADMDTLAQVMVPNYRKHQEQQRAECR